jgi:amino acid transporter
MMGNFLDNHYQLFVRDIIYIIGGSSLLLTLLYFFDNLQASIEKLSRIDRITRLFITMLFVGFSYVIGYMVQDTSSIIGIVTTGSITKEDTDDWIVREYIYERFTREEIQQSLLLSEKDQKLQANVQDGMESSRLKFEKNANRSERIFLHRVIALMQVGTTIGPCWLLCGFIFLLKYLSLSKENKKSKKFYKIIGIFLLIAGIILIELGWIKCVQYNSYRNRFKNSQITYQLGSGSTGLC